MTQRLNATMALRWLPKRSRRAHKGTCGRVYILGGSRGMAGAPILSAWGAVKGGAGLVCLATVKSQQPVAAKRAPLEAMTQALDETSRGEISAAHFKNVRRAMASFKPTVVAVGPGLRVSVNTRKLVQSVLSNGPSAVVADADGLNALAIGRRAFRFSSPTIITPHSGELARLMGLTPKEVEKDRVESAKAAARRFACVCVLKGAGSIVTDGHEAWINTTGNAAMASGGMGDVLTGFIAALWGQMRARTLASGLQAACVGVYLHGLAGDLARKKKGGLSVQASEVADFIPRVIRLITL